MKPKKHAKMKEAEEEDEKEDDSMRSKNDEAAVGARGCD
jgi:hypothetical protein